MSATDDPLKEELLRLDVLLRRKQNFWESPRHIALLATALAAIFGAIFGLLGYKIGRTPPQQIVVHLDQPLVVKGP